MIAAAGPRIEPPRVPAAEPAAGPAAPAPEPLPPSFRLIYREHVKAVWRTLRRLGVPAAHVEDAAQEVFLTVYRRQGDFAGRSSLRTWILGIAVRIAAQHRRTARRYERHLGSPAAATAADETADPTAAAPDERATRDEGIRILYELLGKLADGRREVFILAELEEMPVPEVAAALGINLNTAYARLGKARRDFEDAARRLRAREQGRLR